MDLIINFDDGKEKKKESYNTIMDFLDKFSCKEDVLKAYPNAKNINAILFTNLFNSKSFNSMDELYEHLDNITK